MAGKELRSRTGFPSFLYGVGNQGARAEGKALLVLEVRQRFGDSYYVKVRYERRGTRGGEKG